MYHSDISLSKFPYFVFLSAASETEQEEIILPKQPQPIQDLADADVEDDDEVFHERPLVFQGIRLPKLEDQQAPPLDEKPPLEGPVIEAPFNWGKNANYILMYMYIYFYVNVL